MTDDLSDRLAEIHLRRLAQTVLGATTVPREFRDEHQHARINAACEALLAVLVQRRDGA